MADDDEDDDDDVLTISTPKVLVTHNAPDPEGGAAVYEHDSALRGVEVETVRSADGAKVSWSAFVTTVPGGIHAGAYGELGGQMANYAHPFATALGCHLARRDAYPGVSCEPDVSMGPKYGALPPGAPALPNGDPVPTTIGDIEDKHRGPKQLRKLVHEYMQNPGVQVVIVIRFDAAADKVARHEVPAIAVVYERDAGGAPAVREAVSFGSHPLHGATLAAWRAVHVGAFAPPIGAIVREDLAVHRVDAATGGMSFEYAGALQPIVVPAAAIWHGTVPGAADNPIANNAIAAAHPALHFDYRKVFKESILT